MKMRPEEIPDDDHELVIERVCAIDVAKASGKVCVRLPRPSRCGPAYQHGVGCRGEHGRGDRVGRSPGRRRDREGDRGVDFRLLADLVLSAGVGRAGGAVGQCPRGKYVPGRLKTDLDSVWLAKLTEKGLLRPSFVPAAPIRTLRDYTRLRVDLTRERSRYWQRLEKLLEDALIKVSCVAFTLDTLSVRDMLDVLIAGDRDPRRPSSKRSGRLVLGPPSLGAHGNGEFYSQFPGEPHVGRSLL
jgi:transposase